VADDRKGRGDPGRTNPEESWIFFNSAEVDRGLMISASPNALALPLRGEVEIGSAGEDECLRGPAKEAGELESMGLGAPELFSLVSGASSCLSLL
jgi:hypothetical protein